MAERAYQRVAVDTGESFELVSTYNALKPILHNDCPVSTIKYMQYSIEIFLLMHIEHMQANSYWKQLTNSKKIS